jgi:hypothetical protein
MKKIFILLLFAFQYSMGYGQVLSNCNLAPELHDAYNWDVSKMALTRIIETNSIYKDSIEIPEIVKDTLWAGLAALYKVFWWTQQPPGLSIGITVN